ncbi:5-oxoprolinase subunit C family protein [Aquimarina mytili]|uniref:Biotin-dependent carboxyltransferase family protein n=1 Tax=Aquimarina mytili TaxID=874423 RepID=A0A937D8F6_9FLAO|nr:biotin-dependent carboxyltransferase family protein [Aquimarina mytili]MBL0682647.1 biotin-dependent carboxyltransferase family protein [Aquimarina mytili]
MIGKVKVLQTNFYATIQDQGRFGYAKFGVPKSGAMDQFSFIMANLLLNNDENAACIEFAFQDLVLEFSDTTMIALTGASIDAFLNNDGVQMYRRINVTKGDVLKIKNYKKGVYGYVGILKGFLNPTVLKSRSYYKSITTNFCLKKNDELSYAVGEYTDFQFSNITRPLLFDDRETLKAYPGPEFSLLSEKQQSVVSDSNFTISRNINRMAIVLEEQLVNDFASMLTGPVLPGTVQLTPSGSLIVLMRDCQTTGGYPRILQLSEASINYIAQKQVGGTFRFRVSNTF